MASQNPQAKRPGVKPRVILRVFKCLFRYYPVLMPVIFVCLLVNALTNAAPAIFMQQALAVVGRYWQSGDWAAASGPIGQITLTLACFYLVGLVANFTWNRLMAIVCQGTLRKLREEMFDHMETLPIRYFDTHVHGDIMSYYTNDIDTLRQMISQSLPQITMTALVLVSVFFIMLWYSVWMTVVVVAGTAVMALSSKALASRSARFFLAQQRAIAAVEGHVEEIMNGERVVQVFCHQKECEADFDAYNERLFEASRNANTFANILAPILMNMGNVIYVVVAVVAGLLLTLDVPALSISGTAFTIAVACLLYTSPSPRD